MSGCSVDSSNVSNFYIPALKKWGQGFFQPFWEGALGPSALGKFRYFYLNWENFFNYFYMISYTGTLKLH